MRKIRLKMWLVEGQSQNPTNALIKKIEKNQNCQSTPKALSLGNSLTTKPKLVLFLLFFLINSFLWVQNLQ